MKVFYITGSGILGHRSLRRTLQGSYRYVTKQIRMIVANYYGCCHPDVGGI
jgi:hypothetical protein